MKKFARSFCTGMLLLTLIGGVSAFAQTPMPEPAPDAKKDSMKDPIQSAIEMQPKEKDANLKSVLPLLGYNPTYLSFIGGGYFFRKVADGQTIYDNGIYVLLTQTKAVKFEINSRYRLNNSWQIVVRNELANGFESNYGYGSETKVIHRVDVPLWKDDFSAWLPYRVSKRLQIGPEIEHIIRRNHRMTFDDRLGLKDPYDDREHSAGIGFKQELDFRDIPDDPNLGWNQTLRAVVVKPFEVLQKPFALLDASLKFFEYMISKDVVLAYSLSGGLIFGTPTYLYQFLLGGTDRMRGFYHARFRGDRYYVQQSEIRFPVYKAISAATFMELGETTKRRFSRARISYGAGIRIGLPPDGISKFRIDYAMSQDQRGVFIDFGQAF